MSVARGKGLCGRRANNSWAGKRMQQKYEYKFVRIGEGWVGARREAKAEYQGIVREHARDGWRLVQVFAPSFGVYGVAKYVELIFEKEMG